MNPDKFKTTLFDLGPGYGAQPCALHCPNAPMPLGACSRLYARACISTGSTHTCMRAQARACACTLPPQ